MKKAGLILIVVFIKAGKLFYLPLPARVGNRACQKTKNESFPGGDTALFCYHNKRECNSQFCVCFLFVILLFTVSNQLRIKDSLSL